MWSDDDDEIRRHYRQNVRNKQSLKSIRVTYYTFHIFCIILGIGLYLIAHFCQRGEKSILGEEIQLNVTRGTGTIYSVTGAALFIGALIGLLAQFFKKSFLWLVYCIIFACICMAQFSAAGSTFSSMASHEKVVKRLKELMVDYGISKNNKKYNNTGGNITIAWDKLQEKYSCCGVDNYTDWQSVEFGLTSLRVPPSCCLDKNWAELDITESACGQNMLPDNEKAHEFIHTKGCSAQIMEELDLQLFIMGVFGLIVAVFTVFVIVFSCFLVITKRI